jgi:hypothetical protein
MRGHLLVGAAMTNVVGGRKVHQVYRTPLAHVFARFAVFLPYFQAHPVRSGMRGLSGWARAAKESVYVDVYS